MMFFGFGALTLLASFGWRWYSEHKQLKGTDAYSEGLPYEYKHKKGRFVDKVLIGVHVPKGIECVIRHENLFDRVFKRIGLTKEYQTGHAKFDQQVYFISDDSALQEAVSKSASLGENILAIMNTEFSEAKFIEIRCRNAKLWVEYRIKFERGDDADPVSMASRLVEPLQKISDEFKHLSAREPAVWHDPFYWYAALVSVLAYGLLTNGIAHYILQLLPDTTLLTNGGLIRMALMIAIAGTVSLGILAAILLGRTSRAHIALLEIFIAGGLGLYATAYANLRDFNIDQDLSPPSVIQTVVIGQKMEKDRKGRRRYYVTIRATDKTPDIQLKVSEEFYRQVSFGSAVDTDLRPGRLGEAWISNLRLHTN